MTRTHDAPSATPAIASDTALRAGRLTTLRIHPLKSGAGVTLAEARVDPSGLRGDRRWALVDPSGANPWLGEHPRSLAIHAEAPGDGGLVLRTPGAARADLRVHPAECGPAVELDFPGLAATALQAPDRANSWVSEVMGADLRLVWLPETSTRPVSPAHGGLDGEATYFAWDAPLHLVTRESLEQLDRWIAEEAAADGREPGVDLPLDPARFRPNLIIEGFEPFAEDQWTRVRIGELEFRVSERCDRCAVTLYDPATLAKAKEPIRTLARRRSWGGKTWFGIRLVPLTTGALALGAPVVPLS